MMSSIAAQESRIVRVGPGAIFPSAGSFNTLWGVQPRAVIGVATTSAATARDTLGVLVSTVRPGSPADKAGIEEGNRIASINGVSLRLAAADVGDDQMGGVLSRRLSRELDKLKPGDEVDLRIYASGLLKSVKVKTIAPADLNDARSTRPLEERATLGISLAVTGSVRDTLGVFVIGVDEGGPAAKAGLEEGARIASINGVDVRARQGNVDEEHSMGAGSIGRLEREVSRLKPGDDVELRVYANGQMRSVKLKAGRAGDLPRRARSMTIMGGDSFMIPEIATRLDRVRLGDEFRRAIGRVGGGRIDW